MDPFCVLTFYDRFGYGEEGRPLKQHTIVQRGRCLFDTSGNMTIDGVVYTHSSADDASAAASNTAFQKAFQDAVAEVSGGNDPVENSADKFFVEHRRLHTHINSFNPVIQFAIRSNMDIKVLMSGSDSKGLLHYILDYATKTEQTLDVLLPLLVPVVERLAADGDGDPDKETAVRLVRSCLCKQISSLAIGGPAAASKVLDLPDHKLSHAVVPCPMSPLLAWASSRDKIVDADDGRDDSGSDTDSEIGDNGPSHGTGAIITPVGGRLTVAQRTHLLYRHRCERDDTNSPFHGMSYFVWCRLVRVEKSKPSTTANQASEDDETLDDSDQDGESANDSGDDGGTSPSGEDPLERQPRKGRRPSTRYPLTGDYRHRWQQVRIVFYVRLCLFPIFLPCGGCKKSATTMYWQLNNFFSPHAVNSTSKMQAPEPYNLATFASLSSLFPERFRALQVIRDKPAMVNIMRDIPRSDTQPVANARLLICMFVPFFVLDDIKPAGETWVEALARVNVQNTWDPRTYPFRLNIEGMVAQKIAAAEENARRRAEQQLQMDRPDRAGDDVTGEIALHPYGDDDSGVSVIPTNARKILTDYFVKDAVRAFIAAGFSGDDSIPDDSSPLVSGRSREHASLDIAHIRGGIGVESATCAMSQQESRLKEKTSSSVSSLSDPEPTPATAASSTTPTCGRGSIEPYLIDLRKAAEDGLSERACLDLNERRDRTNNEVAATDIGAAGPQQDQAAFQIAQEFGLNRKQRLAFYIFANGLLAQLRPNPPPVLRLYIGGGAGVGFVFQIQAPNAYFARPRPSDFYPRCA